jgi:hypothetical protein
VKILSRLGLLTNPFPSHFPTKIWHIFFLRTYHISLGAITLNLQLKRTNYYASHYVIVYITFCLAVFYETPTIEKQASRLLFSTKETGSKIKCICFKTDGVKRFGNFVGGVSYIFWQILESKTPVGPKDHYLRRISTENRGG